MSRRPSKLSFRAFVESAAYCGLDLSPLMAAVIDASEAVTPSIDDVTCHEHFGCSVAELPRESRRTVAVRSGGRAGKTSRLVATKALHAAWTVPLPTLRPGEVASAIIVCPDLKLARQALSFVKGYVEGSKILKGAAVEETRDSIDLRRPDGKIVRVEVLAASRGGRAVRGRTLVFAALDEACFFFDETSGVVNDKEVYLAVLQRVVDDGQVWIVSTPWVEGVGLLETTLEKNWGTHAHALSMTSGTRALNPSWDPTGEIEADYRAEDPDAAAREIDGVPMSGGAGVFFDPAAIKACVDESRPLSIPAPPGSTRAVGADLAFSSDSSAAAVVARTGDKFVLCALDELRPKKGSPLKPKTVIDTFAALAKDNGVRELVSDAHYRESAREHLEPHKVTFIDAPPGRDGKNEVYLLAKKLIHEGRLKLPAHPRLLAQLRAVVSKPAPGGGFIISSPRLRGGGHGDLVSALTLAIWRANSGNSQAGWSTLVKNEPHDRDGVAYPGSWFRDDDKFGI